MLKRILILIGILVLAWIGYSFFGGTSQPVTPPAPVEEATPVEPTPSVNSTPSPTPIAKKVEPPPLSPIAQKFREDKKKREIGYRELEQAFLANRVCDFAEYQKKLPQADTRKVLFARGHDSKDEELLLDGLNVSTASPKTEGGRFFKAMYLAGLDGGHPNPQPDYKAAEKMLRDLNLDSRSNIAYIVFLYRVLQLKGDREPDLIDQLIGRNGYDTHIYKTVLALQDKANTATSLHAAALTEKELPRIDMTKVADMVESETHFAAKNEAEAILAQSERWLEAIEKRKLLTLTEYPSNDELIPGKLNDAARNYLLMDPREHHVPQDHPKALGVTVDALRRVRDETDDEIKHCDPHPANDRYEFMKKYR